MRCLLLKTALLFSLSQLGSPWCLSFPAEVDLLWSMVRVKEISSVGPGFSAGLSEPGAPAAAPRGAKDIKSNSEFIERDPLGQSRDKGEYM